MAKLAHVRWVDAYYQDAEVDLEEGGLTRPGIELDDYGVLVDDSPESVTIALEIPTKGKARHFVTIPRQLILEIETVEIEKAFRKPRPRKQQAPPQGL